MDNSEFLFGEKEILNYIDDISCLIIPHSTFSVSRKEIPLPTVKMYGSREFSFATTKKNVKRWLSLFLIKSFFEKNQKSKGFQFLFGRKKTSPDVNILLNTLQTIWIDD